MIIFNSTEENASPFILVTKEPWCEDSRSFGTEEEPKYYLCTIISLYEQGFQAEQPMPSTSLYLKGHYIENENNQQVEPVGELFNIAPGSILLDLINKNTYIFNGYVWKMWNTVNSSTNTSSDEESSY